jgi:hypothetical protein
MPDECPPRLAAALAYQFKGPRLVKPLSPGYVYFFQADNGLVKIGWSIDITKRLREINAMSPYDLVIVAAYWSDRPIELEQLLHEHFSDQWVKGEWFKLNLDDLAAVRQIALNEGAKEV